MGDVPQEIVYASRHDDKSGGRWLVKLEPPRKHETRFVWIGSGRDGRAGPDDFSVIADPTALRAMANALRSIADVLDACPKPPKGGA